MSSRSFYIALDVRGAIAELRDKPPHDESWFTNKSTGEPLTNTEALTGLTCELIAGREKLPMGDLCGSPCGNADKGCTGFNYGKDGGCPGHPSHANSQATAAQ